MTEHLHDRNDGSLDEPIAKPTKKRKPPAATAMSLNLTSMIDVIFLLLIYFVVTASFTMGEGVIVANLPNCCGPGEADPDPPKPKITVSLTTLGNRGVGYRIHLPGFTESPHNFRQLSTLLSKVQHNPKEGRLGLYPTDSPVIISPTAPVRWQHVVNAYNAAIKAKYEKIVFRKNDAE